MSIELAEKIKALARIALEAQSITKDMKKAFEVRSDSLEARVKALELFYMPEQKGASPDMVRIEPDGKSPFGFGDAVLKVEQSLADTLKIPDKRGRGRPKKGS